MLESKDYSTCPVLGLLVVYKTKTINLQPTTEGHKFDFQSLEQ
jgi:hypothetical protein